MITPRFLAEHLVCTVVAFPDTENIGTEIGFHGSETVQLRLDLNPRAGTRTQPKPRLGLEPLLVEITHLVSGLNEAQVLYVSSQKEFTERQNDR